MAEELGRTLSSLIGDVERVFESRWERSETQNIRTEDKERRLQARDLLRSILPPAMRAPRGELVNRIARPALFNAANRWNWGDGNMLFGGPTSIGKTSAVALLVYRLLRKGYIDGGLAWERAQGVIFCDARSLCSRVKEHPFGRGEAEDLRAAKHATLLVLDDLAPDADVGTITELMNYRYQQERRTVTTTGLSLAQLGAIFGDACVRRLYESAGQPAQAIICKA